MDEARNLQSLILLNFKVRGQVKCDRIFMPISAVSELEVNMATLNKPGLRGQIRNRYQKYNVRTKRWVIYDGDGKRIREKKSSGPWKGIRKVT